jgi:Protein of unknown function (DUF1348)
VIVGAATKRPSEIFAITLENWEFDEHRLMRLRIASINDLPIIGVDRNGSVNALVAPTDAKVSTIPSSNRFAFTLVASVYRNRLNRKCATDSSFSDEPTVSLDKVQ